MKKRLQLLRKLTQKFHIRRNYKDEENLIITTMDDLIHIGVKNDVSFLIGHQMNLYEHESTFCPNMPSGD